ncbi:MAG TPA: TolC family protein [Gemmatimonadales bacterium]|nr:TolC family protein [Gemmatimonadales bacterium]
MRAALLVACLLPGLAAGAAAQSPPTLRDVVAVALRQNPDVLAARLRDDSAAAERRIARGIPNPTLGTLTGVPFQYSASASLDVGPARWYRTGAAARGAEAARLDADDVTRQTVFAVRQAFEDQLLAEALRDIASERRDIYVQLLAADSVRLRGGDVPERNVTTSEVRLARADADLTRAVAAVHAARLALQLLMGVASPDTGFTVSGSLAYRPVAIPVDSLEAIADAGRPDVRAADARVSQARALSSFATALLVPTPEITLSYQPGAPYTTGSNWAVGIGLSLPVFYWYGGERARSQASVRTAEVQSRRTRAQVANDVATALDALRAAQGLAERYEAGLLAKSQQALDEARLAYRSGATSLLDLLDAIQTWSDTRADYDTAAHDYWVGVFALSRAVGRDLTP